MQTFWEYLQSIILFGLLSFFVFKLAQSKHFFRLPIRKNPVTISFKSVCVVFAIYLIMTIVVSRLLLFLFQTLGKGPITQSELAWIQILVFFAIFLLTFLYAKANETESFGRIVKDRSIPSAKTPGIDFITGVGTWLLAFPFVLVTSQLVDMFLYYLFDFQNFEQVAVKYLKDMTGTPLLLVIALFTILIIAPIIEEFLFRGCLQTFFKRFLPAPKAICLSSLCFALFHFAASQGIGNISLIVSLFVFALFLGFIYERQASLFASIGLHMTFNAVSVFRILFLP